MYKIISLLIISTIMSSCNSADEFIWNPDDITNPQTDVRPYIKDKVFLSILYEAAGVKKGEILRLEDLLRIQNLEFNSHDYNYELRSLDGIQLLRNLINLNCTNLIYVEEPDFSYNKHLDWVNISSIEIKKLDLSKNPRLRVFFIWYSRSIEEIKLPYNVEDVFLWNCDELIMPEINHLKRIKRLEISNCPKIIELDELRNLPTLQILDLGKMDISSIDLSNCPELVYLRIEECPELREIEMGDVNTLEDLMLSDNKELVLPIDIAAHKNLQYLSIRRTLITTLDVSANLNLKYLYCRDSPLLESVYISSLQTFSNLEVEPHTNIVIKH